MVHNLRVGSWVVSSDPAVMEALRQHVMDRFLSAEPVGEETIGILYGKRDGVCSVSAWRALKRENPAAPAVPLTPEDEAGLRRLAGETIDGSAAVGLFRSRTRGMAALSPEDLAVCQKLFEGRECLCIILRPSTQRPVAASLNFIAPGAEAEASQRGVQIALSPAPVEEEPAAANAAPPTPAAKPPLLPDPPTRRRWLAPAIAFGAGLLLSALAIYFFVDRPVRLRVDIEGQQVRVSWNRSAGILARAESASLRIAGRTIALTQSQLRLGQWRGPAPQGDFAVSLHVRGGFGSPQWAGVTVVRDVGSAE